MLWVLHWDEKKFCILRDPPDRKHSLIQLFSDKSKFTSQLLSNYVGSNNTDFVYNIFSLMSLICQGIRFMSINEILTFVTREEITNSFRCLQKTWIRCAADIRRIKSVNVVANNSNSISETPPFEAINVWFKVVKFLQSVSRPRHLMSHLSDHFVSRSRPASVFEPHLLRNE